MSTSKSKITLKRQQGVALLMSLIMLLLITVIGVSAVRMSLDDTRIAGNSIYANLIFQGAESTLNRSGGLFKIQQASENRLLSVINNYNNEEVTAGLHLSSEGNVRYERILNGPQINGVANSTLFKYQVFQVTADSQLDATSARSRHTEGRAIKVPDS